MVFAKGPCLATRPSFISRFAFLVVHPPQNGSPCGCGAIGRDFRLATVINERIQRL